MTVEATEEHGKDAMPRVSLAFSAEYDGKQYDLSLSIPSTPGNYELLDLIVYVCKVQEIK